MLSINTLTPDQQVSILLIEAGIFIRVIKNAPTPVPAGFNPLNRGGDIHTSEEHSGNSWGVVSILLIEAGIFILCSLYIQKGGDIKRFQSS